MYIDDSGLHKCGHREESLVKALLNKSVNTSRYEVRSSRRLSSLVNLPSGVACSGRLFVCSCNADSPAVGFKPFPLGAPIVVFRDCRRGGCVVLGLFDISALSRGWHWTARDRADIFLATTAGKSGSRRFGRR